MGCNEFSGDPDVWRYLHCVEMFLAFCLALYLWTLTCNPYPKAWSKAVYFTGAAGVFAVGQSLFWIMEDYRHSDCLGVPWAIAFWMEFAFYSTAFVLQVYLLGYWYSVTSLAQPMEWHRSAGSRSYRLQRVTIKQTTQSEGEDRAGVGFRSRGSCCRGW